MTELNELFEQIFHAELKFKARTDKLKQCKIKSDELIPGTALSIHNLTVFVANGSGSEHRSR